MSVLGAVLITLFVVFSYLESGYPFRSLIAKENQDVAYLSDMNLVKEYTFEGDSLNLDEWTYRGNGERRSGYWDTSTVSVHDGKAYFAVKYDAALEKYTGTAICSRTYYTYGYFEAKMLIPEFYQCWGAFWMTNSNLHSPNPEDGMELDIVENLSPNPRMISQTLHYNYDDLHSKRKDSLAPMNTRTNFLTYSILWTPDVYVLYINGIKYQETAFDGTSHNPEYFMFSIEFTDKAYKDITKETQMIVEYVKVYQCDDYSALNY